MRYVVTGATGFVGTYLANELVHAGHDVVAVTRDPANAAHLPDAVAVVEGDVTRKESMREAVRGVDGVFHLAAWHRIGPGQGSIETAERVNVAGTRNVLELVEELGVPKAVHASTPLVYGDTGDDPVDETHRYDGAFQTVYERTKWQAHYEVAAPMQDAGVPVVVAVPGIVYGPGDTGMLRRVIWRPYLAGTLPAVPRRTVYPVEHAADTARSLRRAMARGAPGEEYIVAGPTHAVTEWLDLAESLTGVPAPRSVSPAVFRYLAPFVDVTERVVSLPGGLQAEVVRMLGGRTIRFDTGKAERELGLEHRDFADGLREYLDWEREQLGDRAVTPDADAAGPGMRSG